MVGPWYVGDEKMITLEELMTPPTTIEVAELFRAVTMPNHQLSEKGVEIFRRLIFDWELLKARQIHEQNK